MTEKNIEIYIQAIVYPDLTETMAAEIWPKENFKNCNNMS